MIKKLISLTLASVSTLALAGCGATDVPSVDTSVMGDGTSNKTGLGGYWWSYIDRSDTSHVSPDTGKENPMDTTTVPAQLKASIGAGNGLDDGAFHVSGDVGPEPYYAATDKYDPYWDGFYGENAPDQFSPGVCGPTESGSSCKEMKYPAVGLGFGFHAKNVPLGKDADGKVGVSFKIKKGPKHAEGKPVAVSLPMDLTDAPDPTFDDRFGSKFAEGARQTGDPKDENANTPLCTFVGTIKTDSDGNVIEKSDGSPTVQGSTTKTCFANFTTSTKFDLQPTDDWETYCLVWDDFGDPGFGGLSDAGITAIDPARITKMQFDAFKPAYSADDQSSVAFDFYVDDVILLDATNFDKVCADATQPSTHGTP